MASDNATEGVEPKLHALTRWRPIIWGLAVLLGLMSVMYVGRGFAMYTSWYGPAPWLGGNDAFSRWREHHYVFSRQNPYDVMFANDPRWKGNADPRWADGSRHGRPTDINGHIGLPDTGYTPWTYPIGSIFFMAPKEMFKVYYSVWLILGLATLGLLGWTLGRPWGTHVAALLAASSLAMGSLGTTVFVGNMTVIVVAALIGALWAAEKRPVLAALFLCIALMKPTISGPFLLVFLVKRQWLTAAITVGYICCASALVWALTRTSPFEMLQQMLAAGGKWLFEGYGLMQLLIRHAGMASRHATLLTALLVAPVGLACMLRAARANFLTLFAIAALTGRLWCYHYHYDDGALVFLLLALALAALRSGSLLAIAAFFLQGLTLWAPPRVLTIPGVPIVNILIWIGGLLLLTFMHRRWLMLDEPRFSLRAPALRVPASAHVA